MSGIDRVAVVGAGLMGRGIAHAAVGGGFETSLFDVSGEALEFLHRSLGEKYRPAPLLVQYVKAGRLGKKVGRGVYDYRSR